MKPIIKADFHTHTKYSLEPKMFGIFEARARYTPEILIEVARERGLNALAITEHDTIHGAEIGERYIKKRKIKDFTLIKGEEISSAEGHILGIGIEETIKPGMSADETIDQIKKQGGAVIIPHPFAPFCAMKNAIFKIPRIDGVEIYNPFASLVLYGNTRAKMAKNLLGLASISSSDAHTLGVVGRAFTEMRCENNVDAIVKTIKRRKTNAYWDVNVMNNYVEALKNFGLCFIAWHKRPKPRLG